MEYNEKNINIQELSKRTDELEKLLRESEASIENIHALFRSYADEVVKVWDDEYIPPQGAPLRQIVLHGIKRDVSPFSRTIINMGESTYLVAKTTWKIHKLTNPTKKKQRELLACYKELTTKNNLLIQVQQEIITELSNYQNRTSAQVQSLTEQLEEITGILNRITTLRNHVETPN